MATREEWLMAAADQLSSLFPPGMVYPALKISVGWARRAKRGGHKYAEVWGAEQADDKATVQIFISPMVSERLEVLLVLLHTLVHVHRLPDVAHNKAFSRLARYVGLRAPWGYPAASEGLGQQLQLVAAMLGPYPHVTLWDIPRVRKPPVVSRIWSCACGAQVKAKIELHAKCLDCQTLFAPLTP